MSFATHTFKDCSMCPKTVYDLKWNTDGTFIAAACGDKTVRIGQMDSTGSAKAFQTVPSTSIANICWHPSDVNRFAFASDEKYVEVWDVRSQKATGKIKGPGSHLYSAWSPDGNYVAVGNRQDIISVFDVRNPNEGAQVAKCKFAYEVNEIAWSANSDHILAATGGDGVGSVELIAFSGSELSSVLSIPAHSSNCTNLRVDPTFTRLALGGLDHLVSLWDLDDMICHRTINMEAEVRCMSFSCDGSRLAAVADEASVLIVDTDSGECITKAVCRHKAPAIAWHPKQNIIAVAPDDRTPVPVYLRFLSFNG